MGTPSPGTAVSVIIPVFNAGASLTQAIDSALSQTLSPARIIVVNDGSTDGTSAAAQEYGDRTVAEE